MKRTSKKNEVVLQVLRANLKFYREDPSSFRASNNRVYHATPITCRIHQTSRKHVPVALYHLAKLGLAETLAMYNMHKIISLSSSHVDTSGYTFVNVNQDVHIKIKEEALNDAHVVSMILSLLDIFRSNAGYTLRELCQASYYATVLGKMITTPRSLRRELLHKNAVYHLQMNESILDPAAIKQYQSIGIKAENIDDLLLEAFFNLDMWLSSTREKMHKQRLMGNLQAERADSQALEDFFDLV